MRSMKQIIIYSLVILLTCSTILSSLPMNVFAETANSQSTPDSNPQAVADTSVEENLQQNAETIVGDNTQQPLETNEDTLQENIATSPIIGQYYLMKFKEPYIYNNLKILNNIELMGVASSENTYDISIGSEQISIDSSVVEIINPSEKTSNNVIDTITTKESFTIYKDLEKTIPFINGSKAITLNVLGYENNTYIVEIGNIKGYLTKDSVANLVEESYAATIVNNGDLLSTSGEIVGKIYNSSTLYSVAPTDDPTKYNITIGTNNYLIDTSLISLSNQSFEVQKPSRNEIIQLQANTNIYSDSQLSNVAATITDSIRTSILDISGSNYLIQIGNTIGYVPISSTTGKFTVKLNPTTKLYSSFSKEKVIGVTTSTSTVYTVSRTSNNDFFSITIGTNNYYVEYSNLTFTSDPIVLLSNSRKDLLTTKEGFVLYKDPSTNTPLLKSGRANQKFVVVGTSGQYYIIHFGNTIAYLPVKYATGFGSNKEVSTSGSTILYKKVNNAYYPFGTLKNGFTFKPTSANSNYYLFTKDNETYAVKNSTVVPSNKTITLASKKTATFPSTLYAEKNIAVYDAKGNHIGAIYKGKAVSLKGISTDNKAIIDFMGQQAQVKFNELYHKDLINGKSTISHSKMSYYIKVFSLLYPEFTEREVIGYSSEGRAIYALRVGNGKKEILMDASFHAREHMTTNVLLEMIDTYSYSYNGNANLGGWNVKNTLNQVAIWFLPMMNPDGVMLVQQGISALKNPTNIQNAKKYAKDGIFLSWKANGRGVDLNRNFGGVSWEKIPSNQGYSNYKGPYAFSELETQAFVKFVNKHNFKTNISYHTSGNIIYWGGVQTSNELYRDSIIVNKIAKVTGYSPIKPMGAAYNYKYGSGNSTSWLISEKRIPAITIEISPYQGEKPVELIQWTSIWNKNRTIGLLAANEALSR